MPLETKDSGDCRGTEADGSKSEKWCTLCYADGRFRNPEMTQDEMVSVVDTALREQKSSAAFRYLARKQIPRLERWQHKRAS